MKNRILGAILSICMIIALIPSMAFAETWEQVDIMLVHENVLSANKAIMNASIEELKGLTDASHYANADSYISTAKKNLERAYNYAQERPRVIGPAGIPLTTEIQNVLNELNAGTKSASEVAEKSATLLGHVAEIMNNTGKYIDNDNPIDGSNSNTTSGTNNNNGTPNGYFYYQESCGNNAAYSLSYEGVLTISGTGAVTKTWGDELFDRGDIKRVIVEEGITSIRAKAFYRCVKLHSVSLPSTISTIEASTFAYCKSLQNINITNNITKIETHAFSGCESLKSITLPNGLTYLGDRAFDGCSGLTSINIPFSLEKVGVLVFSGTSITNATIPQGMTVIPDNLFYDCESLISVTFPDNLQRIGEYAFKGTGLTSVDIPDSVIEIGDYAFAYTNVEDIKLPNGITEIPDGFLNGCKNVTYYEIPKGVTRIGKFAFKGTKITSIVIPKGVKEIDRGAFSGVHLNRINIPYGVKTIGEYAFEKSKATSITLPNTLEKIGYKAFTYLSATGLTIPASVKNIEHLAFAYNPMLKTLTFKGTKTNLEKIPFLSTPRLSQINAPKGFDYKSIKGMTDIPNSVSYKAGKGKIIYLGIDPSNDYLTYTARVYKVQIRCSTSKTMKNSKTITVGPYNKAYIRNLTSGKKYYVQSRMVRIIGDRKLYSAWTGKEKIVVK